MSKLKHVVKTKDKDGKDIELAILLPSAQVKQKAQMIRARTWADAVKNGVIMREVLDQHLREQGLWDDKREADFKRIRDELLANKLKLDSGGIRKSEGRTIALKMASLRNEYSNLLSQRNRVDNNTADAIADQAQFNYLVAACTVYDDSKKPYFTVTGFDPSLDAYIERATEQAAQDCANKLAEVMYGTEEDIDSKLPENEFLRKYGFADDKNRLINANGDLIDEDGRLINENGRFINKAGEYVDKNGTRVDEDGNYIVEFKPFLDDEEEPSAEASEEKEAAPDSETE